MKFFPFITLIYFLFLVGNTMAQTNSIIGTQAENDIALCIYADNADNSYVAGSKGTSGFVLKQNPTGGTVWAKSLNFSSNAQSTSEIGYIEVLADTIFGCGWVGLNGNIAGAAYFKMNATTGNLYWMHVSTDYSCFSAMKYSNGKYLLVAAVQDGGDRDGKVIGVSSQTGTLLWETPRLTLHFPPNTADHLDDFISATDIINGKMFITGRSYVNGASSLDMRPLLIGVDINGNVILNRYLLFDYNASGTKRYYGNRIEYDGADSLVIAYSGDEVCSGNCQDYKNGVAKCDLLGNVKYAKSYDIAGVSGEIVRSFNVTPTGYVFFGLVNFGQSNILRLYVMETDKQGNFIDCRIISPQNGGVYTTYCGVGNFAAGSNRFVNGKHYFVATTYTNNSNLRDIKKIVLDQNLNSFDDCSTNTPANVVTSVFAPFSGPLNLIQNVDPLPFIAGFANNDLPIVNPCDGPVINLTQQGQDCTNAQVTASVTGISTPVYAWSNGESTSSISINSTDSLFVIVTNPVNCCKYYDTIVPSFSGGGFDLQLPADTNICFASVTSFTIEALLQNASTTVDYSWSTGASETGVMAINPITVLSPGTYWIDVTDNCGTVSDTIHITDGAGPGIDLAATISICEEELPYVISPVVSNADSISWEDGTQLNDFSVVSAGTYTISAFNSCGVTIDSIQVIQQNSPLVNEIPSVDTCLFAGELLTLTATGIAVDTYLWSTGETTANALISNSGNYWVAGENSCGTDTTFLTVNIQYFPQLWLPSVLDTCFTEEGFYYTAQGSGGSYSWSSGSNTATEWFNQEGIYTCTLTNSCGSVSSSMEINKLADIEISIPSDSMLFCVDALGQGNLGIEANYPYQLLNDQNQVIGGNIIETGWYTVLASNACGQLIDSIYIDLMEEVYLYLPNTFTPNKDETNELYDDAGYNYLIERIEIFNRWGEIIYSESGDFSGWDGNYHGLPCPDGIYQVQVIYNDCAGRRERFNGHVLLLR